MAEEIFIHKHVEDNGDIIEMHILKVPKTPMRLEGINYSLVYIRKGKRLVGYDNFEGHGEKLRHHRHVKYHVEPYTFVDEWKLIEDFMEDVEKVRQGVIR